MPSGWIAIGISAASLVVGTIVALRVAALHRQQMRLIEMHRTDPTVPLVPPPHRVTRFLKQYALSITAFGLNIGSLISEMFQKGPLTRLQVFSIALSTGALLFLILLELARSAVTSTEIRITRDIVKILDIMARMNGSITELFKRGGDT
jgi:hypothetical protein